MHKDSSHAGRAWVWEGAPGGWGASRAECRSEPSLQGPWVSADGGGALTGQSGLGAQREAGSCLPGASLGHTSSPHSNPSALHKAELGLHTQITP